MESPEETQSGGETPRRAENRRLSLSFHGIAKATPSGGPPSPSLKGTHMRHLDRRLSLEFGGLASSNQHSPVVRKTSLGVPSPNQLSRRNSLEVPHVSPRENPASPANALHSTPSAPLPSTTSSGGGSVSPRSPLAANVLQRRQSLEIPFDRRLSQERRPSAEDFLLARRISIDKAASLGNSPVRRLSSSSFTAVEVVEDEERPWPVPFGRRDSRGSTMSDVEGGSVADSGARLSVGPGSPTQGLKRPASAAFDYTAFEAAGPDLKRPRSPSVPRIPSPLTGGVQAGSSSPTRYSVSAELTSSERPAALRSPRSLSESSTSLIAPGSLASMPTAGDGDLIADSASDTGSQSGRRSIRVENTPSGDIIIEAEEDVPSNISAGPSGDSLDRREREKIQVVAYDEESGATVTLDHETDTAEILLECPPVRSKQDKGDAPA